MRKLKYLTALLAGLFILSFSCSVSALELNYSAGSVSGSTGAGNTTSGYSLTVISPTYGNNVGYRFSVVNRYGNLKAGSSVVNVYLSDTQYGESTYSSAQRFVAAGGVLANKKQLAGGTSVYGAFGVQAGEYLSDTSQFYYNPSQNPASIRSWIQDSSVDFQNLNRINAMCSAGSFGADDYVLIEPILRITLAGVVTAATPTELAVYGAAVSGGGGYNGANGS